jgi:enterobactin synthetase component F
MDPAYLIYTSGSTGRPKAVINTHAGLLNRMAWMRANYRLTPEDRVVRKTPATFDVSIWEFLWPLMTGARLVLPTPTGHRELPYLAGLLTDQQISVAHFVPSVLRAFLNETDAPLPRLRQLFCSGEALSADIRDQALRRWPHIELHNLYGPTEASIEVTATTCRLADGPVVSIGRPITNMQTYVLDPRTGQPSPIGVPGDFYLAGIGLASHYANRPALTAERFLPNPFGAPGTRMYATGDLARWQSDGTLDFLGRTDHQVKLNGQRIEPGEIEHVLTQHVRVSNAAVVLTSPAAGAPFLTGYFTTADGQPLDHTELRSHLSRQLPLYMIPSVLTQLPEIPLSANGKLDRSQLPDSTDSGGRPPATRTQRVLAELWAEVLDVPIEDVHLEHNFFAGGGSSLDLMKLIGGIRDRVGVQLELRHLYLAPTLGAAAALVEERATTTLARTGPVGPHLVPLRPGGDPPPLLLVHATGGSAAPYLPLVRLLDPDQPVYAFEAAGLAGNAGDRPATSIEQLAEQYLALARERQPDGPYLLAGWSGGGVIAQHLAVLLRAAGERVALLALLDSIPADPGEIPDRAGLLSWFADDVAGLHGAGRLPLPMAELAAMPAVDQLELVLDRLEQARLTEAGVRSQLRARFEVFSTLAEAFLRHRPQPVDVPIDLLTAAESPDPLARWQPFGDAGVRAHQVPGNHYSMLQPPQLAGCAAVLQSLLERSRENWLQRSRG